MQHVRQGIFCESNSKEVSNMSHYTPPHEQIKYNIYWKYKDKLLTTGVTKERNRILPSKCKLSVKSLKDIQLITTNTVSLQGTVSSHYNY